MRIAFERFHGKDPHIEIWGAKPGASSYTVTFDRRFPELGWRASWATDEKSIVHLPNGFRSKREAMNALEKISN